MNSLPRLVLCALTGAVLLLAFGTALGLGPGGSDPAEVFRRVVYELRRGEHLEAQAAVAIRCEEGKREVVRRILAGRLTLVEAVEEFRALGRMNEDGLKELLAAFPGSSEDEALCRSVIFWVAHAAADDPARRADLVARLKAEMRRHFGGAGAPPL
jgi:hypothetical protein